MKRSLAPVFMFIRLRVKKARMVSLHVETSNPWPSVGYWMNWHSFFLFDKAA